MDSKNKEEQMKNRAHILIIDDDPAIGELIQDALEPEYATESVSDPIRGLEILRCEPYDLLILDLGMPRMSGTELIQEIRSDKKLARLAILVVSAYQQMQDQIPPQSVNGSLSKPFVLEQLVSTIRNLLSLPATDPAGNDKLALDRSGGLISSAVQP